jgi:hypothetical protein
VSSSRSKSSSRSTGRNLLSVQLPKCLRGAINLSATIDDGDGSQTVAVNIPATNPTDLPWGTWYEVGTRNSEYWKYGVWVTEKVEVYLETPNAI